MAAEHDEKTEPPTARRRSEARQSGQIAKSQDLSAAVMLLAALLGLKFLGPGLWGRLLEITRSAIVGAAGAQPEDLLPWSISLAFDILKKVLPLMLILSAAGLAAVYAQTGWIFTWKTLMPKLDKLNPINGVKRIFSLKSFMMAVINVAKIIVVCTVAYITLRGSAAEIINSITLGHQDVFWLGAMLVGRLGFRLAVVLLILALLDYAYQRFQHERDLRMTKQEIKDEFRSMEGDPVVRRRRREIQLRLAMQRIRRDVPTADVVVTNPTHVSIAIRYDAETMMAPKVVAKGADYMALRIRQIASEFGIPIVERKALARVMYDAVEVGAFVPERFYQAIAEILAYVYELTGRSPVERGELVGA